MNVKKMIEIEPRLLISQNYVIKENLIAKGKNKPWFRCWIEAKKLFNPYVGDHAENYILSTPECWSIWSDHIFDLGFNFK